MKKRSLFFYSRNYLNWSGLKSSFHSFTNCFGRYCPRFSVEVSSLGVLTSLPLLMFALFSSFATRLAQKIGLEHLFTYSLIVLTIGSVIRIFNLPLLYLGTLLIGVSIAIFNVLLPSAIQANHPQKIGFLTTNLCDLYGDYNGSCLLSLCTHYSSKLLERLDSLFIFGLPTNFGGLVT